MSDENDGPRLDDTHSARVLIAHLREVLGYSLGERKQLSAGAFARELTKRLGDHKPITQPTAWRWLEGRSTPSRATLAKLRQISEDLARDRYDPWPESAQRAPSGLKTACIRARLEILGMVRENAPHRLIQADEIANAAEQLMIVLGEYVQISDADADAVVRWSVLSALPAHDAAWFHPATSTGSGSALTLDKVDAAQRWYFYPTGLTSKLVLALLKRVGEMARVP